MRSSWLSVEVNSFFMRSASSCAVTSRPCAMIAMTSCRKLTSGVTVHSQIRSMPSRRGLRILSPAIGLALVEQLPPGAVELGVEFRPHQLLHAAADQLGGGVAEQHLGGAG